ncbi:hypothetical protein B4Q13_16230 [Lacticaseibacillus rhamnosus]
MNAAVQSGYNVIILAANDKDALVPALSAARKKGVTVVTYDSDVAQKGRSVFINQASSQGIGTPPKSTTRRSRFTSTRRGWRTPRNTHLPTVNSKTEARSPKARARPATSASATRGPAGC